MAGLAAFQNYVNSSTPAGFKPDWNVSAGLARLGAGTTGRFMWWSWAWNVIMVACLILALASAVIPTARISLVAFTVVAALLSMISANMLLDIVSQRISPAHTSAARCASAGFILSALSFLALMYSVGLVHNY